MLFLLFGSSCSGKTVALDTLRGRIDGLASHDFDEIGVPSTADTAWRQRSNELWVQRALAYEADGIDLLLAGQTHFGELLAAPSARRLEGFAACLLDCDDEARRVRIQARGPEWLASVPGKLEDFVGWAAWMRRHAADPAWRQDVIRDGGAAESRWDRWCDWKAGDSRWRVTTIDTTSRSVDEVADELRAWIARERRRRAA